MTDHLHIKESNRFLIIVTGFQCENYVDRCYKSLLDQKGEWIAVFVDDESTDQTWNKMRLIEDHRVTIIHNERNIGAAASRLLAVKLGQPNDIILLLGMDDCLRSGALERIEKEYRNGKWMTYGSWQDQTGKGLPRNFELDFDRSTHENRDYRKVKYRSTAPNTMRKWLFDLIPEDEYKIEGQWMKATTESHLMFSCLEMCGKDRIGVIKDKIYTYTRGRKDNARNRFGSEYQDFVYQHVINLPKKEQIILPI
jgi:glycosyltransferase involved in cell wall biosynthesis